MGRSFTPDSLVSLPALKSSALLALLSSIESSAEAEAKLNAQITESLEEVHATRTRLQRAFFANGRDAKSLDPRPADLRVDEAWGALESWLRGWKLCNKAPLRSNAASLYDALFPDGLRFLSLKFREEWGESAAKLSILAEAPNKKLIEKLGGAPFIAELTEAQAEYGKALGVTKALAPSAESPELRAHFDRARAALRDYVLVVAGFGASRRKGARAIADRLLAPLEQIESTTDSPDEKPAPAPTPS